MSNQKMVETTTSKFLGGQRVSYDFGTFTLYFRIVAMQYRGEDYGWHYLLQPEDQDKLDRHGVKWWGESGLTAA